MKPIHSYGSIVGGLSAGRVGTMKNGQVHTIDSDEQKVSVEDVRFGVSLALTCLLISLFLYYVPFYLGIKSISYLVSLVLAFTGVVGLGLELKKMSMGAVRGQEGIAFDDLGIGLGLLGVWLVSYRLLDFWLLNAVTSFLLFFGCLGTISGLLDILHRLAPQGTPGWPEESAARTTEPRRRFSWGQVFTIIVQVVGLVLGVLQVLQIVKVIR